MEFKAEITVPGKPRMTRSDAWKGRDCVRKYFAFKDEITLLAKQQDFVLPEAFTIRFILPMPKSWSKKKKLAHDARPHKSKPDLDNLLKSVMDCLLSDDSAVYRVDAMKVWGRVGKVKIWS